MLELYMDILLTFIFFPFLTLQCNILPQDPRAILSHILTPITTKQTRKGLPKTLSQGSSCRNLKFTSLMPHFRIGVLQALIVTKVNVKP